MKNFILISFLFQIFTCYGQTSKIYERVNDNNSWGFIDENGKEIIPLGIYEFLNPIDEMDMILAKKDEKDGYIDIHQNILIPFDYDDIGVFTDVGLAPAVKDGKSGAINRKGEIIIPFIYDKVDYFYNSGLAIVIKDKKFGCVNASGDEIIPVIYEYVDQTMLDEIILVSENKKIAFFSNKGQKLTEFKFDKVKEAHIKTENNTLNTYFKGGLAIVTIGDKQKYLDKDLNIVVELGKYEYGESLNKNGFGIVAKNNKFGIINNQGIEVIPLQYDKIEQPQRYSNVLDVFVLQKKGTFIILDGHLNIIKDDVLDYTWDKIDFDDYFLDVLLVKNNQYNFGIIDENGKTLIPFDYEDLQPFNANETTIAKKNNKFGIIDFKNKELISFENDELYSSKFSGIYFAKQKDKFGIFNKQGNSIMDFVFEDIQPCYYDDENKFIIKSNGKYGMIDITGKKITPIEYDEISNWVEYGPDAHFITKNKKKGIFSRDGEQLIPPTYDELNYITNDIIIVSLNKKYGIINLSNKNVIPLDYDEIYLDWYKIYYENQEPEIYVLRNGVYSQLDKYNKQIRTNISKKEIKEKFDY